MIPEIEQLLIIQDRDQKLKELNSDIKRLPLEELQAKERLITATTSVEISEKAVMENEIAMKNLELDIDTRKDSITKLKVQQMETKKNDEFAVMEHSINNYQSEIVKLEDSQLELMEKGESLSETLQQNKDDLSKDQEVVNSELTIIRERKIQITKKVNELEIDRKEISTNIAPDLLDQYNRIFKSKKGDAVSELINNICSGCHMKVTPSTALAVRAEKVVTTCDQCGRVLYI